MGKGVVMANITKNQIKARLRKIIDELENQKMLLEELKDEVENESCEIEPYEGKDELTEQQEERQDIHKKQAGYLQFPWLSKTYQ